LIGVAHHIVADRISQAIILTDFVGFYLALLRGEEPDVSEGTLIDDVAARSERAVLESTFPEAERYWREKIPDSLEELALPFDRDRPAHPTGAGDYVPLIIDQGTHERTDALAGRLGVSRFELFLAVWTLLLHRYSQGAAVAVQVAMNTRTPEQEGRVGMFVNTVPVLTEIDDGWSFEQLVRYVNDSLQEGFAYRSFPFARIVEIVAPRRDRGSTPLTQCGITYSKQAGFSTTMGELTLTYIHLQKTGAKADVALELLDRGELYEGGINYASELFDRSTIERMVAHFETLLDSALSAPGGVISELELLKRDERRWLLEELNRTEIDNGPEVTVPALFEAHVAATPDAAALVFEGDELTYRELDRRANRVAHLLRGLLVGPGTLVAVAFERSVEMVVAILGVLKAGGAYVPLDPAEPPERLTCRRPRSEAARRRGD
jgi:non-ribosomal peptide synthetase component F